MMRPIPAFLSLLSLLLISVTTARASHIFASDFFYTHVSGNTYNIKLIIYGDCAGSPVAVNGLYTATPEVEILDNGIWWDGITLTADTTGVDVTPVCPAQAGNTTCYGGTVPGIRKFVYSAQYTLPYTSTDWMFRFTGDFLNATLAGRSNSITNIILPAAGSQMALEATLNNTVYNNSSPVYTTIPTPFFCINKPQQYNPGAVDPNLDSLTFSLVDGIEYPFSLVTYINPYTAAQPLATAPGSFSFSTTTGQLNFNPNLIQNSLVVGRVSEYRNGTLVGTSMREMTFIVLGNCNNNPPGGNISNVAGGTLVNSTTVQTCTGSGTLTFSILPADADGHKITVVHAGLPSGAALSVTGSGTLSPSLAFSWDVSAVPPGAYTFYVTYTDDGCPLSSKQTVAYTVIVAPRPAVQYALIAPATCTKKAVYSLTPAGTGPWSVAVREGTAAVHSFANITGTLTDSLKPGTYTIRIANAAGCSKDTTITLVAPAGLYFGPTGITPPTCAGYRDGAITLSARGGDAPYSFSANNITWAAGNRFEQLPAGTHAFYLKDANGCRHDTTITLTGLQPIVIDKVDLRPVSCFGFEDGAITVAGSNGVPPLRYALGNAPLSVTNTFTSLKAKDYLIRIVDSMNCKKDTTVWLPTPEALRLVVQVRHNPCTGADNRGEITVLPAGGTAPYAYAWSTGGTGPAVTGLPNGSYRVTVADSNNCTDSAFSDVVFDCCNIYVPNAFTPNADGRNDRFRFLSKGNFKLQEFSVFNRFGQRVFVAATPDDAWDGNFNGTPLDMGVYFYHIRILCGLTDPEEKDFKGDVTLIR